MNADARSLAAWQAELIDLAQNTTQRATQTTTVHTELSPILPRPSMDKRKKAYQNNYQQTLLDWLSKSFPMIRQLVGEKYFELLAHSYIQEQPLNTNSQSDFGVDFPTHIKGLVHARDELKELPYLIDIATADWMLNQAYYAKNCNEFDTNAFSTLEETQQLNATFVLAKDVFLLDSHWPIHDLWEFHHQQTALHQIQHTEELRYFLITRKNLKPVVINIDEEARTVLQCVIDSHSIASMPSELTRWIAPCIENGWITGFVVP